MNWASKCHYSLVIYIELTNGIFLLATLFILNKYVFKKLYSVAIFDFYSQISIYGHLLLLSHKIRLVLFFSFILSVFSPPSLSQLQFFSMNTTTILPNTDCNVQLWLSIWNLYYQVSPTQNERANTSFPTDCENFSINIPTIYHSRPNFIVQKFGPLYHEKQNSI